MFPETGVIETALITAPPRENESIFGRPLLERLMILCERAGITRFVIEAPMPQRADTRAALGRFRDNPAVGLVDSLERVGERLDPSTVCIRFSGNLVMAQSDLGQALARYAAMPAGTLTIPSTDPERGGAIMVGPLRNLLSANLDSAEARTRSMTGVLPFSLNGRPEDRTEAELRLARSIRHESLATDALMARVLDRRISWRISLWLARWRIAPNAVTLANTALGFGCAAMLASTSYWTRLVGAILFLVSITLDGVDGELARLRMVESRFGGQLDVFTDNLVHVAIFAGLMAGCYRTNHSAVYLYLLVILLTGFGFCAISVNRALRVAGAATGQWISRVERATGRDFAYVLLILALLNRLSWFAWTAALGTYGFALVLWLLTTRRLQQAGLDRIRTAT
jgi:phosphatidylglycerophosphate synthase